MKNKLKLEVKSKILVLGLILIVLIGLFPIVKIQAAEGDPCTTSNGQPGTIRDQGLYAGAQRFQCVATTQAKPGDACTTSNGQPGTIRDQGLYASPRMQCVATIQPKPGDACTANGQPGTIQDQGLYANPRFQCVATTQPRPGDTCTINGQPGTIQDQGIYAGAQRFQCVATNRQPGQSPTPASTSSTTEYKLLAPLPCPPGTEKCDKELTTFDTTKGLGNYLNLMIKIFIGLCAVLSVVMIVMGGLEYMTSELISSKEAGKERIMHAILGLLIALGAYALLFTINPDLLKSDINIAPTTVTVPNSHPPTGTCSDPQYTTATDCGSHEGSWTAFTGTCSIPQFTTALDCGSNEGSWTTNP